MPWGAFSGQDDEIPIPPHRGGDLSRPFQFAKRWFLAHVIDTSRCAIISGSQRNRCGHVLHVASRRATGGQRLRKDDVAAPVSDALHYGMKTTQWIPRSIHHWQPEYRAGKFTIVHDNALGRNLVIIVSHPRKDLAHELQALGRVRMQTASQLRL